MALRIHIFQYDVNEPFDTWGYSSFSKEIWHVCNETPHRDYQRIDWRPYDTYDGNTCPHCRETCPSLVQLAAQLGVSTTPNLT
jgi:thiol-disulfide isomerase/thioredoxin